MQMIFNLIEICL